MECGDPRGKSKRSDTHPPALALNSVGYHFVQRIDLCLSWLPAGKSGSAHGSQRWGWVYIRRTLGIPAPDCKNIEKRWVAGAGGTCTHRASLLQGEACLYFSPGICPRYLGQLPLPIPRKKLRLRPPPSACFHLSPAGHFRNSTHSPESLQHPPARGCFILHCRQDMGQDSGGAPAQWRRREATKGWQFAGVRGRGGMPPTDSKGL